MRGRPKDELGNLPKTPIFKVDREPARGRPIGCWSTPHYAVNEAYNIINGEEMEKIFNGQKKAKLGTKKRPAVVHVQTEERMKEVALKFEENGWKYTIGLEPDKPEDITDLEILLNTPKTRTAEKKVGRNEPCPCGSGKKYKKCCGK